ncbi:VOC family protein [Fictibacillus fluitans]|uniref:VOC family protein n=1 Tax=Fictibacillus fluitans TaxID=3058422 RepID=A0ABT8HYQ8_9BACL|nr:VOC family protein [Fictibacillus sp. NE201]MDN4525916.1 VOC family protein [Fictibacillus sp. NE201]
MKLGNIMIFVSDITKAKWFYANLLNIPLIVEKENQLIFQLEGTQLVAFKCEKNGQVGDYSNEARTVLVFEVDSIKEKFDAMKAKGIQFLHEKPTEARYAAFVDPFGNVFEIAEPSVI